MDTAYSEDLWTKVLLSHVGTECENMEAAYQYEWNFSNLVGGMLHGQKVYLVGCTESQALTFRGELRIVLIPVVVSVVSSFPPSDKIGIRSVQEENEQIVPMEQMKMEWVPYIPSGDRLRSQIYILSYTDRAALEHFKIEYCLPYFYDPFKEDDLERSTVVSIVFPAEPRPVICDFDWELDELEEFTDELIKQEDLAEDQRDAFKDLVEENIREAKRKSREAREKVIEDMSEERSREFKTRSCTNSIPCQHRIRLIWGITRLHS